MNTISETNWFHPYEGATNIQDGVGAKRTSSVTHWLCGNIAILQDWEHISQTTLTALVTARSKQNVEVMLTVLPAIELQQSHTRGQASI